MKSGDGCGQQQVRCRSLGGAWVGSQAESRCRPEDLFTGGHWKNVQMLGRRRAWSRVGQTGLGSQLFPTSRVEGYITFPL